MNQITPPLDINLATLDTSFQLIADGIYDFNVMKAEVVATKKGGKMIHLELATTAPAPSRLNTNDMLSPGVRVFHNQNIVPTGKATWDTILKGPSGLAALAQTAGAANELSGPGLQALVNQGDKTVVAALQGKQVRASIKYVPAGTTAEGKSFREKNEVSYWVTKK